MNVSTRIIIFFRKSGLYLITSVILFFSGNVFAEETTFQAKYGQNVINYVAAVKILHGLDSGNALIKNLYQSSPDIQSLPEYDDIINAIKGINKDFFSTNTTDIKAQIPERTIVLNTLVSGSSGTGTVGSGVSLPMEARIINAAADLIIDRLQQELALSFFKNFKEKLQSDSILMELMPRTYQYLSILVDKSPLLIPSLGSAWKGAFEEDLKALPQNFVTYYMQSSAYKNSNSDVKDCFRILQRAIETYTMIRSGKHPADIIHYFRLVVEKYIKSDTLTELQQILRLLDHLSQNLLSGDGNWVNPQGLKILEDGKTLNLFLRLLVYDDALQYTDNKYSVFYTRREGADPQATDSLLTLIKRKTFQIRHLLDEFRMLTGAVETSIKKIRDKQDKSQPVQEEDYRSYVQTVFDAIKFGHKLYDLRAKPDTVYRDFFKDYLIPIGENAGEMIQAIHTKDYGVALSDFITIISTLNEKKNGLIPEKTLNGLLRFSSFMMDVVNAKDVDQTKQALNSAALPAGSYSLKRKSLFSMNLSAYPGFAYGWEKVKDTTGVYGKMGRFTGLTVPIGIDLTFGVHSFSFSAVLGIADLGTLVSYRIDESKNISSYPVISFRQIFAPSLGIQVGIGDTPLTAGFSWQLAPQLREITSDGNIQERERDASRLFFNIGIDLNFFNFYTTQSVQ